MAYGIYLTQHGLMAGHRWQSSARRWRWLAADKKRVSVFLAANSMRTRAGSSHTRR